MPIGISHNTGLTIRAVFHGFYIRAVVYDQRVYIVFVFRCAAVNKIAGARDNRVRPGPCRNFVSFVFGKAPACVDLNEIVAGPGSDRVLTSASADIVVACTAVQIVRTVAAVDDIIAISAKNDIVACKSFNCVITSAGQNRIHALGNGVTVCVLVFQRNPVCVRSAVDRPQKRVIRFNFFDRVYFSDVGDLAVHHACPSIHTSLFNRVDLDHAVKRRCGQSLLRNIACFQVLKAECRACGGGPCAVYVKLVAGRNKTVFSGHCSLGGGHHHSPGACDRHCWRIQRYDPFVENRDNGLTFTGSRGKRC